MSAITLALLLAAAVAVALGAAALHTAHALRRQVTALRAELLAAHADARTEARARTAAASIPAARTTPDAAHALADIRAAVADALAEERERELAEARAFWAAQEARDAADAPSLLGPVDGGADHLDPHERLDDTYFLPRQSDLAGLEPLLGPDALHATDGPGALEPVEALESEAAEEAESAELAAARRRHPSHPDFTPSPAVGDHERTVSRLEELARDRTPLADVRPGPLGTLDVYVFTDGTTICMTPGHRETAERVVAALRDGSTPVLLGGSGISGAYALTFSWGPAASDSVYILADRVIASL
ncbi:hypothetical protein A6A06_31280 [Streptomyces sp. CB02923]|uniref:hypothetical protein n=1 Tax=Streptomyces sp. CB02923 TaxID=1718985 RepID=UPI00093A59BC|nr:hypothetical protein [Streptomyces sp. CB02923]OKH97671.1 hypothetical protein A6A06_31280 [Streptomyces sp. CB02923]